MRTGKGVLFRKPANVVAWLAGVVVVTRKLATIALGLNGSAIDIGAALGAATGGLVSGG